MDEDADFEDKPVIDDSIHSHCDRVTRKYLQLKMWNFFQFQKEKIKRKSFNDLQTYKTQNRRNHLMKRMQKPRI